MIEEKQLKSYFCFMSAESGSCAEINSDCVITGDKELFLLPKVACL